MRKRAFCICESRGAALLSKSGLSSLYSSVNAQSSLYRTWSETPKTGILAAQWVFEVRHMTTFEKNKLAVLQ